MTKKAKVIFWDLETSPIITNTWSLYPERISHDSIIKDWTIICGAWKELGKDKIYTTQIEVPYNDKQVVKKLREVIASADILVHHNGDRFDLKKFNTRLIYHKLPPLPPIQTVDTLKLVKKVAAFSSNRLDYLSKQLIGVGKVHVDYELWLKVMSGDKKALKQMVDYNKVDVLRLEEIYLRLVPYAKSHPHIGAIEGKDRNLSCPTCGSIDIKKNGTKYTAAGVARQEIQCNQCHHFARVLIKN